MSVGILAIGIIQKTEKTSTQITEEDQTKKKIALVLTIIGAILLFISGWRLFVLVGKYFDMCPEMFFGELLARIVFD